MSGEGTFFGQAWDRETERDFYVASDGHRAMCITIAGLTLKQAARVRVGFDEFREANPGAMTSEALATVIYGLVEQITGGELQRLH